VTGLQPRFITAELTTADLNPKMAHLKPLAAESLNKALGSATNLPLALSTAAAIAITPAGARALRPRLP
jgi:FMN-dependent NADH-azoreductase